MQFFEHTYHWIRGEIFEGQMLIVWGLALIITGVFFWKLGFSPTTRALILPFMIVGAMATGTGSTLVVTNKNRIESLRKSHEADSVAFIKSEHSRVEAFSRWYRYLMITWSFLIIAGVIIFWFIVGNSGRAIAIGLILLGLTGFLVDHTSEQNALNYASKLREADAALGP